MKPRATWIITALCLALLGGAMAWITRSVLRMEEEQNRMANDAAVQEMSRLALWRMEGIAWNLVLTESGRPAEDYRTFSVPQSLVNNGTFSTVNKGEVLALSPLLTQPSEFCKLYFEMDGQGRLYSPQVPAGKDLGSWTASNSVPEPVMKWNTENFSALTACINRDDGKVQASELPKSPGVPENLKGNRALMWSVNGMQQETAPPRGQTGAPAPPPMAAPGEDNKNASVQQPEEAAQERAEIPNTRAAQFPGYAIQQRAMKPEQAQAQQKEINDEEARARQEIVASNVGKMVSRRANTYDNALNKPAAQRSFSAERNFSDQAPPADLKKDEGDATASGANVAPQTVQTSAAKPAVPSPVPQQVLTKQTAAPPPVLPEATPVQEVSSTPPVTPAPAPAPAPATPPVPVAAAATPASVTIPAAATSVSLSSPAAAALLPPPDMTPAPSKIQPLWLGEELLLTRRVTTPERQWIQGVWLDWNKLREEMLDVVKDRFPSARVVKAPENPERGAHLLAALPVQLIPGTITFPAAPFWSPLKVSLSIAWLCVLLAVAAVALVLRGMMSLSERRASFVSSVTHELRTPLATFKIYSEMLADGMVKEEAKKQQYLETLTGEADRLGHLVENVLAYSRIERGKGPTAAASVRTGELVDRVEPRLNQRTLLAGMDFGVTASPGTMDLPLRTDVGAVEQILCNLVDNACKYGRGEGSGGKVELVISRERRRLCLAVRDYGPGIPKGEQNTIFLPFHKSARDAAHSAPGVGLGLALCRRLACELRGTLEIDRSWKQGACFVLRLPV